MGSKPDAALLLRVLVSLVLPTSASAFHPQWKPAIEVTRTAAAIEVDGELTDPGWSGTARATGFSEVQPGDQVEPPVESEVWIAYDDAHLYLAFLAHDDPRTVRAHLRERDDIWEDDYFGIVMDPFGDHTSGFEFFANPLGIQGDLRVTLGGESEDLSFDAVWSSKGRLTPDGYQVEVAIPFASLRFPDRPPQAWRINLWRNRPRDARQSFAWAALNRDDPCEMCNWGTLSGLDGIRPGNNLDAIASLLGTQSGARRERDDGTSAWRGEDPEVQAAANLRYALGTSASTELALNPDFSQIESDVEQIDVNQPFAIGYPEKRPFFQDGQDLWDTWIPTVYTRSINDPDVAGKFTGRFGRLSTAYIVAHDASSPFFAPLDEATQFLGSGATMNQMLRSRESFGENSFLGFLATDRRMTEEGSGTVASIDGAAQFLRNYRFEAQAAWSHTAEQVTSATVEGDDTYGTFDHGRHTVAFDGESFSGHGIYASMERHARHWSSDFDYRETSPTFRTENGFTDRNDLRQANWWNGVNFQPNRSWLIAWGPRFGFGRRWSYANGFREEWIRPHADLTLKYQTEVFLQYWHSRERWDGHLWNALRLWQVDVSSSPSEQVGFESSLVAGRDIWRTAPAGEHVLGRSMDASFGLTLKPTARWTLAPRWIYARMRDPSGAHSLYDGYILRTRLNCQITRELSTRLVVQYDDFGREWAIEPLLTYRVDAYTVFYLGAGDRSAKVPVGSDPNDPHSAGSREETRHMSRQVFAKLQYLFRV